MQIKHIVIPFAATAVLFTASSAFAQRRHGGQVPDANMVAVGAFVGASVPNDPALQSSPDLGISAEGYFSPRVSVRGQLSAAWWDVQGHSFTGTAKPMILTGDIVYNFERGRWHPYVDGGVGMYRYRFTERDIDSHDTKAGANIGGGVEYFVHRHLTITGEIQGHVVSSPMFSALATYNSRFWTANIGVKKYF